MLIGAKVVLRKHALEDAPRIFKAVDEDRARLSQFLPWVMDLRTVQDETDYIRITHTKRADCVEFDYSILTNAGEYAGNIGVHGIRWAYERCEIGYWLVKKFEGRGILSAALATLERALFDHGFHRIEIHCDPLNARSAAVPKRNGYVLDGTLRQNVKRDGEYRDSHVFSKLRAERAKKT